MIWYRIKPFAIILPYKEIYKAGAVYFNRPLMIWYRIKPFAIILPYKEIYKAGAVLFLI